MTEGMTTDTEPVTVPRRVYNSLKAGLVAGTVDDVLHTVLRDPSNRTLHPGDGFGRVVAWVWERDRDEAVLLLADYLAGLREHHERAGDLGPRVRLDEMLAGLQLALPGGFTDGVQLADYTRRTIRGYYSVAD
ncbi:MAG: hypothetical protein GEV09_22605 [Pseudonocardiaceae bacterium]|nr:hypothetical protein [Pseudonocardiaceae bacterium]